MSTNLDRVRLEAMQLSEIERAEPPEIWFEASMRRMTVAPPRPGSARSREDSPRLSPERQR